MMKLKVSAVLCTILLCMCTLPIQATAYYLDFAGGSDRNSGTSPGEAWSTLSMVSERVFSPGDSILLICGGIWNSQQLAPRGSGSEGLPILISSYGDPVNGRPVINGNGAIRDAVYLFNQQWIEVRNLEITNFRPGDRIDDPASFKRGIYIAGHDCGRMNHICLVDLFIHDVNGYGVGSNEGKDCGGIFFEITGRTVPSWFDDLLIEGCFLQDVTRTGISNKTSWHDGKGGCLYPNYNVRIRNTVVEKAGFNAMIPRFCDGLLVEHCTFIDNGRHGNGNAIFQTSCSNSVFQYNEAYGTVYNPGDHDAAGFDGGGYNSNTIIQYNYSHDNGLGGIVIGLSRDIPNENAIIRYNILENNYRQAFRLSGPSLGAKIYNNTIYIGPGLEDVNIIFHKTLGQSPDGISYYNNIFYVLADSCYYTLGKSTNNTFSHNLFYGNHPGTEPEDPYKLTSDPMLYAPGTGGRGRSSLSGYRLMPGSPCKDAGMVVDGNNGGKDFWGNPVPVDGVPDIGANEPGN